jgi:hypothetical protein
MNNPGASCVASDPSSCERQNQVAQNVPMTAFRIIRWIVLLTALIASVSWSYTAIGHLLSSSMAPADRTAQYDSAAEKARVHQMDLAQQRWGRQTMFSVAVSFFFLVAVMMNWVLDGRVRHDINLN